MKDAESMRLPQLVGACGVDNTTTEQPNTADDDKIRQKKASFRQTLGLKDELPSLESLASSCAFPQVFGHRGALYAEVENTLPAFLQCVAWKCAGVELDAFCTKDGSVVVFHGTGTDQGPGYCSGYCVDKQGVSIVDLDYEETRKLRFNPFFAEFPCPRDKIAQARIPLLVDVLKALRGTGLQIKIELKGPHVVEPVLQVVESLDMTDQCSYSSFDHSKLTELRTLRPCRQTYPTGALFSATVPSDYLQRARACGATAVHLRYDTCTTQRVQAIRRAGLQSMAWLRGPRAMAADRQNLYPELMTMGDKENRRRRRRHYCHEQHCGSTEDELDYYQALWETGVDQICCNRPDVAMKLRSESSSIMMLDN